MDKQLTNEVENALKNGLIDELIDTNSNSMDLINRLVGVVKSQELLLDKWEAQNHELIHAIKQLVEDRDRARDLAIRLEAECHGCMDTVHHGNEEQY